MHINDLDVENAYHKSKEIIEDARKFKPGFIEIECYRFFGHARMDKSPYRNDTEEKEMRKLDPKNMPYGRAFRVSIKLPQRILF